MRKEIFDRDNVVVQGREKQVGGLPEGWRETEISSIAEIVMGQSPSGEDCNKDKRGIPLLNGPTEFGGHHPSAVQYTTDAKKICMTGDILFCVRGSTTGRMNWADKPYAIGRGLAAIRHKSGATYQPYLKGVIDYNLLDLLGAATGSTFPNVSREQLLNIKICLPPLPEQKAIAAILGALDDKIEANRKMNATLEGIARALFKSWFVDFDPVRRNMARQQPPLPSPPPQGGREHDVKPSPHEGGSSPHKPSPLVGEGWEGGHTRLHLTPAAKEHILQNARNLRKNLTDAEKLLWGCLRAHRLAGYSFRRQQPIGKYIVDFVCFEQKLIIEADGGQHADNPRDKERDAWLESQGFHVLRFWNNDVLGNIEGVLLEILRVLEKPPLPTLPHKGGGLLGGDPSSTGEEGWHGDTLLPPPPLWGRAGEGGLEAYTALDALFPASFTDSPLGEIPAGWRVLPIGDVVTAVGGGTPSTSKPEYWEGGEHYWATPKDFSALGAPVLLKTDRKITAAGLASITSGLLPAGSVLMSSRAPIGYIAISAIPVAINQGFIGVICNKELPNLYIWQWLHQNMDAIKGRANGSTFQEISKSNFRPLLGVIPPKVILTAYVQAVFPVWDKIVIIEKERQTLATLRDTLLPKLISGQIRVGDVGKLVETIK